MGIAFEGHVPDAIRASEAVAAGQRTFEHLIGIFEASTPDEDAFLKRKYGAGKDPSANKSLAAFLDRYDAGARSEHHPAAGEEHTCGSARRCSGNAASGSST